MASLFLRKNERVILIKCILCAWEAKTLAAVKERKYYQCPRCSAVFLDPANYLSSIKEKERYEEHNNDVEDPAYQDFVAPVVSEVRDKFGQQHQGLDFGAGTGPVITKLLREKGYRVALYDPFFWDNPEVLKGTYDFIVCCEVIEHFHSPLKEFGRLNSLLRPGGMLFCMTDLYCESMDFQRWYYKDDSTHVFFYHPRTLEWLKGKIGFSSLEIKGRLIMLGASLLEK